MFSAIKFINKLVSKNRTIINNFLGLSTINGINLLFPILVTPILIQKVGLENFGKIAFIQTIGLYLKTIIDFGFESILIFRNVNNKDIRINSDFSTTLFLRIVFFLAGTLIFGIFIIIFTDIEKHLFISTIILSFTYIININWVFIIKSQTKIIAVILFFTKLLYFLLIVFFIKEKKDFIMANDFLTITNVISTLVILLYAIYNRYIKLIIPSFLSYLYYLKHGMWLFLPILISTTYSSLSVLTLGFFYTKKELGIYSISEKIVLAFISIINVFNIANFPILSKTFKQDKFVFFNAFKRFEKLLLTIGFLTAIMVFISSKIVVSFLLSENQEDAVSKIKIMCFAIIFSPFGGYYNQLFILLNRKYVIATLTAIYLSISLSLIIIISKYLSFDYFGYNYLFTQVAVFMIGFFTCRHFLNKEISSLKN